MRPSELGRNTNLKVKGKKILILAGAAVHTKVVLQAKDMGLYTIVTDNLSPADSPAKQIADEFWDIDIMDVDRLVEKCSEIKVDGVISFCIDPAQRPYQQICEKLNLPCYCTREQIQIMTDKKLFKQFCIACGVDVIPDYKKIDESVVYPVLIKPAISRGSRGQTICYNAATALRAVELAKKASANNTAIIERYMSGCQDLSLTYLVINGEPYITKIGDRYLGEVKDNLNKQCIATIAPSRFTNTYLESVDSKVKDMIRKAGITFGPVFLQGFIDGDKVRFYDPGLRFPGGDFDLILKNITGFDTIKTMLYFAITGERNRPFGNPANAFRLNNAIGIQLTLSARPGMIAKYSGFEAIEKLPYVISVSRRSSVGTAIPDSGDIRQRVVEILILAPDSHKAMETVKSVYKALKVQDDHGNDMMVSLLDPNILTKY